MNAVNDPPTASDNTVLTQEDITYVFTIADFSVSYSDAESDPLAEIRITRLESVGSLLIGGTPVALNDVITAAQLTANQLTFVPVAGQSGSPYDTFDFEVGMARTFPQPITHWQSTLDRWTIHPQEMTIQWLPMKMYPMCLQ